MADIQSVKCAINEVISRINRLEDPAEIGAVILRLDYINRMIVNLDLQDDIVYTMCSLHDTVANIVLKYCRRTQVVDAGYQARLKNTGSRGRPAFDIPNEQLSFLLEQGFGVPDISRMLGVGQRTVQRRMAQYGLTVAGKISQFLDMSDMLLLLLSYLHKESWMKEIWGKSSSTSPPSAIWVYCFVDSVVKPFVRNQI